MAKYEYEGKAEERKVVARQGAERGCGIIYLPKDWVGKKVAVVLLSGEDAK